MLSTRLYTKKGKTYTYWGEYESILNRDVELPEGLWIVTNTKNSHGIEYIPKDNDEVIVPAHIQSRHQLKERILKVLLDKWKEPRSLNEIATLIAKDLIPPKKRKIKTQRLRLR